MEPVPFALLPGCSHSLTFPRNHPSMRYDYILIRCRTSLNMDKKDAKRETVRDQTLLLNEVRTFTGKHLTQSDVGEVRRAVTNTGKYAVPIYYIRVHEDDPVSWAILIIGSTLT
jgi:hypothetical protein